MGEVEQFKSGENRDCLSFDAGCVGCCVNPNWADSQLHDFLVENTRLAHEILAEDRHPQYWELVRFYFLRTGWTDLLFTVVLFLPTLGLSTFYWMHRHGSCAFAGYLDKECKKAGCLIHPERIGYPDARLHAYPLNPMLACDPELVCPMLHNLNGRPVNATLAQVSRQGHASLKERSWSTIMKQQLRAGVVLPLKRLGKNCRGALIFEYVMLLVLTLGFMVAFVGVLTAGYHTYYHNLVEKVGRPLP